MRYLYNMDKQSEDPEYLAGSCNIGHAEKRRRYIYGYGGLLLSVVLILVLETFDSGRIWRLLLCLPAGLSMTGLLQAGQHFCLNYGLQGVSSVKGMHMRTPVTDDASRHKDRKKAVRILFQIIAGTLLITLLYYLFPM